MALPQDSASPFFKSFSKLPLFPQGLPLEPAGTSPQLGPIDQLDHSSRLPCFGSKMGIDATTKTLAEGFTRPWPNEIKMDAETKARIDALWPKLGLPSQ